MSQHGSEHGQHGPRPTLWPVGFAVGIAILLLGTVLGWVVAGLGALLTLAFGFLWIREATGDMRGHVVDVPPERREVAPAPSGEAAPVPANVGEAGAPVASEEELERFPRSRFLEGATVGVGGLIGAMLTLPSLGFMVLPAFKGQGKELADVGAVDDFPVGEWRITTFLSDPEQGEVSRRTAFVRNNGELEGAPSFTVLSSRCVHLGCPVQANGPVDEDNVQEEDVRGTLVRRIPSSPAGFGCPCHGGQYDPEGNRTAGPPVRALDRYEFSIRGGRLVLGETFSVDRVEGEGRSARLAKYDQTTPGVHVAGPSAWLYPIEVPR